MLQKRYCNKNIDLFKITKETYHKKYLQKKQIIFGDCGLVSMKLCALRKALKLFLHHLSQ